MHLPKGPVSRGTKAKKKKTQQIVTPDTIQLSRVEVWGQALQADMRSQTLQVAGHCLWGQAQFFVLAEHQVDVPGTAKNHWALLMNAGGHQIQEPLDFPLEKST